MRLKNWNPFCSLEDLDVEAQAAVLAAQPRQLLALLGRQPVSITGIDRRGSCPSLCHGLHDGLPLRCSAPDVGCPSNRERPKLDFRQARRFVSVAFETSCFIELVRWKCGSPIRHASVRSRRTMCLQPLPRQSRSSIRVRYDLHCDLPLRQQRAPDTVHQP
jgi:hypothetical protein